MLNFIRTTLALLGTLLLHIPGQCENPSPEKAEDSSFDTSDFLLRSGGVFPVPAIITEPAVGFGGGVMLLHFSEAQTASRNEGRPPPPNITGVGGLATENGSRGAAMFHFHTWGGDRFRYLGALASGRFNLDYYGASSQGRSYEIKGAGMMQQLLTRLGHSPWYAGPRYTYFHSSTRFTGAVADELSRAQLRNDIGKLGLIVDYDTRDNLLYPTSGTYAGFEAQFARPWLGSGSSFESYRARSFTWVPMAEKWTLGLRADSQITRGTVPFFGQPYVELRGVSRGRYQDRDTLTGEVELRWNVTPRWSVLGFSGVGKAYGQWNTFSSASNVVTIGTGFRYLIARKLGLAVGVDVAHSRDQNAFYIQVGSAWR